MSWFRAGTRPALRFFRCHPLLSALSVVGVAAAGLSCCWADRQLTIDTSPSVIPGVYVRAAFPPAVGTLIEFRLPPAALAYVQSRVKVGRDTADWFLLKPVVAGPGDRVDTTGDQLVINGRPIATMPPNRDGDGRPLPRWRAARRLGPDEFFAFSARIPNSFDSRCYGPVRRDQVTAVRRLLWAW
jgi:conjugative transfer signal peptidase TraF